MPETTPNHILDQYDALRNGLLKGKKYDYNALPSTGQQAAHILQCTHFASMELQDGRPFIKPSFFLLHPFMNGIVLFLTIGLVGIIDRNV